MHTDCRTRMAKVEYADAIKTVSGALTKINKKSQHAADQKMVLATHRVAPTQNPNCSRLYLRGLNSISRSTPDEDQCRPSRFRSSEGRPERQKDHACLPLETGERGVRRGTQRLKADVDVRCTNVRCTKDV